MNRPAQPPPTDATPEPTWGERDKAVLWHPFTPMAAWIDDAHQPLVIVRGSGPWLFDEDGNRYLDGNSSIWTNIHGHSHPALAAALQTQIESLDHASFLGTTHPTAIALAEQLLGYFPDSQLQRVFFSDNGSTAIEVAVKMAIQFRQQNGQPQRNRFAAFAEAYHGDTMGAGSLGGVETFYKRFKDFGFQPLRLTSIDDLEALPPEQAATLTAVVIEPLIQGVNHMKPWPTGMLSRIRHWCDDHDVLLILDEVMTGFGRTGKMFACQHEDVVPDFLCLAKGLTGGTMPLAATLATDRVFNAFLNGPESTFYYGHSYCANPLGCAVALASLKLFETENTLASLPDKIHTLGRALRALRQKHPDKLGPPRQTGFIGAIDLYQDAGKHLPWPPEKRMGATVCHKARQHGLLTRNIGDTIVLMPPLCTTETEVLHATDALDLALNHTAWE